MAFERPASQYIGIHPPGAGGLTGGGWGIKRAGMDDPTPHRLSERIARLEGGLKTSRAENDAMESRIEARLAGMQSP